VFLDIFGGIGPARRLLPAAVLGGVESFPGALVGGLVIGVVESLAGSYVEQFLGDGLREIAAYIVLLVRPTDLWGLPDTKRV